MRRFALAALVSLLIATAAAAAVRSAQVRLADSSPVAVRGTGFKPQETVRVTVSSKTTRTRTVVSSAAGTFTARFAHWTLDRCAVLSITAKGSKGSSAFWKIAPMCAAPTPAGGTGDPDPLYPTDPTPKKR